MGSSDLIDDTPILDLKPYLPYADAHPEVKVGWIGEIQGAALATRFRMRYTTIVMEQIGWLRSNFGVDFMERAEAILRHDPSPNRSRRIRRYGTSQFRMGCGPWRIVFSVHGEEVVVEKIEAGYPPRVFSNPAYVPAPHREVQAAFLARWPINETSSS